MHKRGVSHDFLYRVSHIKVHLGKDYIAKIFVEARSKRKKRRLPKIKLNKEGRFQDSLRDSVKWYSSFLF